MRELNLDILLLALTDSIRSKGNVRFLTNYSTAFGSSVAMLSQGRRRYFLVPAGAFQLGWAKNTAWVTDIRAERDFAAAMIDVLSEIGGQRATIGLVGFESLPGSIGSQIIISLSETYFENATKSLLLIRSIKSPDAIEMRRRSAELADHVFEDLNSTMRIGISKTQIFARAEYLLVLGGAEDHFLLRSSGPRTIMPMPVGRSLQ